MRTVTDTIEISIKVNDDDLLEKKWIPHTVLSKMISDLEKTKQANTVSLKTRFYNSLAGGKYNTKTLAHIKCLDTVNTMVENKVASLNIKFIRG